MYLDSALGETQEYVNKSQINNTSVLVKAARGDQQAISDCIDQYGPIVYTLARRMLEDKEKAYDLTLVVFSDLWQTLSDYDQKKQDEKTFVTLIARRKLTELIRKDRLPRSAELLLKSNKNARSENELSEDTADEETHPLHRRIARMALVEGRTAEEIGITLGIKEDEVRQMARRLVMRTRAHTLRTKR